jgi:hypothetical protein
MSNTDYDDGDDSDEEVAAAAPKAKVRLYLRATGLHRSITGPQPDSRCRVCNSGEETEIVSKSCNPSYIKSFLLEYEYGTQLIIYVDMYVSRTKNSSSSSPDLTLLERVGVDVRDVLGTKSQQKARNLKKGGTFYFYIEQEFSSDNNTAIPRSINDLSSKNSGILTLRLRARSLVYTHSKLPTKFAPSTILTGKPDTYFELSRPAYSASTPWIVVYRSPPVTESITPMWDETMIDLNSLCSTTTKPSAASSEDLRSYPIRISIYKLKKKKRKEIGSFETTVQSLIESCRTEEGIEEDDDEQQQSSSFILRPKEKKGKNGKQSSEVTGEITVVSAFIQRPDEVRQRSQRILSDVYASSGDSINDLSDVSLNSSLYSSVSGPQTAMKCSDYVDAGLDIDLCVAIDFTSSNGDPRVPGTLHYSRDGMTNDYEDALQFIGGKVEKYSKSKEFPVWGFGAKFDSQVRHIFQCGQAPTATGIQGVLDAYRSVFESDVIMSGPTVLLSVLKKAAARAKANKVHKDSSEQLKYSVILILTDGVVNDLQSTREFVLKCQRLRLPLSVIVVGIGRADFTEMNQWNEQQSDLRGCFTFVEFRALQFDPEALSRKALERVPHDVVDYFSGR